MAKAKTTRAKGRKAKVKTTPLRGGSRIPTDRLQLVESMMSACCSRRDIVLAVVKKFGVTEKTAYGYYDKVEREWQDEAKPRRRYRRAIAIKRLENAYKLAMKTKKASAAVRAVEAIAKVDNLYEPDEVIITDITHPTEAMTSAQRRAYINEKRLARARLLKLIVKDEPTKNQLPH
jgi:hypothetical protein